MGPVRGRLVNPDGSIDHEIRLPVSNVACMGFGEANFSDLCVTTGRFISPRRPEFAVTFRQGSSKQ